MAFLADLVRRIVPRSVRNAVRMPRVTEERLLAKLRYAFGKTATVNLTGPTPQDHGCEVRCHPMCVSEFSVFTTQPEQINEMRTFVSLVRTGMRMMDIGAHWGALTLAALHFGGEDARVLAIEASDEAARIFKLNLRLNNAESRVILVNAACGDRAGEIPMLTTGAGGADYFVVPADARPDTIRVKQVSADDIRREHGFDPTHLKIDVEGYEEEVLKGAQGILRELRPIVFLELHGDHIRRRGQEPERVLELLADADYSEWWSVDGEILTRDALEARGYNARLVARPS